MKKTLVLVLLVAVTIFSGCSGDKKVEDKPKVTVDSGTLSSGVTVGKELAGFSFKNQFDKEVKLDGKVKKIIFVFTKPTGHLVREYLKKQPKNYLESRETLFIADISGMPSIIAKMFAIPDMKKSSYSILLIREKDNAKMFRNEQHKDAVMIISLDNKIVKNVNFVTNEKDLKAEIE